MKLFGVSVAPDPVVLKLARVSGLGPFLTALENEDAFLFFCQTAGGDGPAETAADDYNVVIHSPPLRHVHVGTDHGIKPHAGRRVKGW